MEHVASLSGVSLSTASRALRADPRVARATVRRVREAAEQLGYRPDQVARALATGTTDTLGLIVPSTGELFWGEVAAAVQGRAAAGAVAVLLANTLDVEGQELALLELLREKRVRGVVVGSAAAPDRWPTDDGMPPVVVIGWDAPHDQRDLDLAHRLPLDVATEMFAGSTMPGRWLAHLELDEVAAGRLVARHLIELGHRRVSYASGPPIRSSILRMIGIRAELRAAGADLFSVLPGPNSFEGGEVVSAGLPASGTGPTAVICYNDQIAAGVLKGAQIRGMAVPEQLSVTGFDDVEFVRYLTPTLTTVRQPKKEMGELAARLLLEPPPDGRREHRLDVELAVRASTGPKPTPG